MAQVNLIALLILTTLSLASCGKGGFYAYKVTDISGEEVALEQYEGKVALVVNVASECGYTDEHYRELTSLHSELALRKREPFTVLAFPCNQFGQQEPHDNPDIEKFARETYGANFPLFSKIDVTDRTANPAFRFLREDSGKEPTWNFWKYLVGGDGHVIGAWGPRTQVREIKGEILKAIAKVKGSHREL